MESHHPIPTEESIERLHVVNQIRDLLKENHEILVNAGILEVLLFGSVEKGTAKSDSDIDLCFIHKSIDSDFIEFSNKLSLTRSTVSNVLSKCQKAVSFHPPQDGKDQNVIHITLQPENEEIRQNGKPSYAADSYSLWKSKPKSHI